MTAHSTLKQTCICTVLYFSQGLGLARNIRLLRKKHKESTKFRTAQGPKAETLNSALEQ